MSEAENVENEEFILERTSESNDEIDTTSTHVDTMNELSRSQKAFWLVKVENRIYLSSPLAKTVQLVFAHNRKQVSTISLDGNKRKIQGCWGNFRAIWILHHQPNII